MSLSADDCLYPRWSRLKPWVFWPAATKALSIKAAKEALNGGILTEANAKADADGFTGDAKDTAARWYVGYVAAQGRIDEMSGLPNAVDVRDEGSSSSAAFQLAQMVLLRDEFLQEYDDLVATAEGDDGEYTVIQSYR